MIFFFQGTQETFNFLYQFFFWFLSFYNEFTWENSILEYYCFFLLNFVQYDLNVPAGAVLKCSINPCLHLNYVSIFQLLRNIKSILYLHWCHTSKTWQLQTYYLGRGAACSTLQYSHLKYSSWSHNYKMHNKVYRRLFQNT